MNCSFYDLILNNELTYQFVLYDYDLVIPDYVDHRLDFLNGHLPIISINILVYRIELLAKIDYCWLEGIREKIDLNFLLITQLE